MSNAMASPVPSHGQGTTLHGKLAIEDALDEWLGSLSITDRQRFEQSSAADILALAEATKAQVSKNFQGQARYMKKVEGIIKFFIRFNDVISVMVSSKPEVAALVWGMVKLLVQVSSSFGTFFEKLTKMLGQIQSELPDYSRYERLFQSRPNVRQALVAVYIDVLQICMRIITFFEKPGANS
ncbi:hypothetical protein ABW19_dt0210567 [Dactylella cylindrospora]|nr:hypothetical protein ABW19_dt0210567 [Dactylella cylindrospora]